MEYNIEYDGDNALPKKMGEVIFELSQEFVEVELAQLSELVFGQVYK